MSSINKIKIKKFHHYFEMPHEVRMMVIDQMETSARCRFTSCSKLCEKEAKTSKNYICSLSMYASFNYLCITVSHNENSTNKSRGYCLEFEEKRGSKTMSYRIFDKRRICWQNELDVSTNLHLYCADKFKQLLKRYQDKIKSLSLSGFSFRTVLKNYDFEIDNLIRIQCLEIAVGLDSHHIVSKLCKPLKSLIVGSCVENCEQIYQVQNEVNLSDSKLTFEQMKRLSATNVEMVTGYLTEENIFEFITSWQEGTNEKEIEEYKWVDLRNSNFDIAKLFGFFGKEFNMIEKVEVEIKHHKKENRAKLFYKPNDPTLTFQVESD